ncbi:flagellar hook-associated protein FlgL [Chengkuizengella axinellae]|uniref:Flagellar hook-associated protein FlgL n=1 Tax=Chengkuizengella axinellae TaxID=3064388 RepID=A0ABT9J2S9_9BACL|nr:flagellar hook-associated protein FlgL [Chengkuizengella sp. 2205SS18-9]MDP5275883.1 flagellar hook-associated protein FlgL [Chengkuizengella sp. 2205SS18-9]
MRVTSGMMNTQLLSNLNKNLERMTNYQEQLSSTKKINKPSDDPVGVTYALRYRADLSANEQYTDNVNSALSWLDYSDSILDQANEVMDRVRELTVQASNGTNDDSALDSIKEEMEELYGQLVTIGNSEFNGKYVFNGQQTNMKPYTEDNAKMETTDSGQILFEIGEGSTIAVNVTGEEVFGGLNPDGTTEEDNAFKVIQDIITQLENEDFEGLTNSLGTLDSRIDKLLVLRAEVGARTNRVELTKSRLEDNDINLQTLLSKTEDADLAQVVTKMTESEYVYQAALSVGANMISVSLVDFLR